MRNDRLQCTWMTSFSSVHICIAFRLLWRGNMKLHALHGYPVSESFVSWCQTLKNSSASFLCIQKTNPRFFCHPTAFFQLAGAVGCQRALHKENSGFASPTVGRHISMFRGYQILFSIRNPYINHFTNHFSIHS